MKNKPLYMYEKFILEQLFRFEPDYRKKIYNLTVIGESNQVFARAIIKYMLHVEHLSPYETEEYIRKYMVIFVYSLVKSKMENFDLNVGYFDEVLKGNVTIAALKNDDIKDVNVFTALYLKTDKAKYLENCTALKEIIISSKTFVGKQVESIINILRKDNHYFTEYKDRFDSLYDYYVRNYDEMIAETLVDDELFSFKIDIDDDNMDAFNSNFMDTKSLDDIKKIRKTIFGYVIYDAMLNDNLDLSKPVRTLPAKIVKLYLGMKNASTCDRSGQSVLMFLEKDIKGNNIANLKKIKPFDFTFNDIKYHLDKDGIKAI